MKRIPLHWQIIMGLVAGIVWALLSSYMGWSKFTLDWINPFGKIFINLLKLIAVPLVLFSIISGIAGLVDDTSKLGRLGIKTLVAYLATTFFAVAIGLTIVNLVQPGSFASEEQRTRNRLQYELWALDNDVEIKDGKSFLADPDNASLVSQAEDKFENREIDEATRTRLKNASNTKEAGPLRFIVDMVPSNIFVSLNDNKLMLQVIFFAIFFGITLLFIDRSRAGPVIDFINGINEVFLKMVELVMRGAPFFVFALLAGKMSEMAGDNPANVIEIFKGLAWYSLCVVVGLGLLVFIVYPGIILTIVRKISYMEFFRRFSPAQLLAFSSSSSAATLPVTMECVRDNIGVSKQITSFVLPIGATVNMDGTSLYQAVAVVFLAQFHFVDLNIAQQLIIVLTATLASIGSAAVPSAGLVMMILVLSSVGLPGEWIAIIFPVDRILDMCRTVVNVTGDATVATVIADSENELNYQPNLAK